MLKKGMFDKTQCIIYHWMFETHIILKILTCLHIWFTWKFIIKNRFNYILFKNSWKHMWICHYHPIMGPIQNMEAMFQTWKNIVLRKDLHLGSTGSFYCECTHMHVMSAKHVRLNVCRTCMLIWLMWWSYFSFLNGSVFIFFSCLCINCHCTIRSRLGFP